MVPTDVTGYSDSIVAATSNATIIEGSTLRCGKWFTATLDDSCASICVESGITLSFFLEINPSLTSVDCTSSLVVSDIYYVGPIRA